MDSYTSHQPGDACSTRRYTLDYWLDDGWFIGRLRELPGLLSQGATIEELEANILEAASFLEPACDGCPGVTLHRQEVEDDPQHGVDRQ